MDNAQILAEMLVGGELHIHLIGVAGSGMSGIAGLLIALGHHVSGSDKVTTLETERLQKIGLAFHSPHRAAAVSDADLVIYSSAVRPGNVEYDEAVRAGKSMARRADALAAIMNCKKGIVVAGMHGKTTTSAMAAHVLRAAGLKPSHYVGAEIPILGTNANWEPDGEYFVAEGDESDGTLALYRPEHAIILNIEPEHLDYYEDLAAIEKVFNQLLDQTTGRVFYCADDPNSVRLCAGRSGSVSFGEAAGADYRFAGLETRDLQSRFDVFHRERLLGSVCLNVPGRHNVSNAAGVIALALELGVPFESVALALESFRGAKRRFEIKYHGADYLVLDDYAHHPTEIRATLATARAAGGKRLLALFQPHRFSRTLALRDEFGAAFGNADLLYVTGIYPASEQPIPGVTGQTIVDAVIANGHRAAYFSQRLPDALYGLGGHVQPADTVISLGAGNVHEAGSALARDLAALERLRAAMGPGAARLYEPIAKHTTLRVGGPAQFWLEPETEEGFASLVRRCRQDGIPLMVMGRGSNLLVRDGGILGAVVHLARGEFRKLEVAGCEMAAGVGVKLKELSYAARDACIGGLEWMEGIPGNVGGGLRMNAGAMGSETFANVVSVRYVDGEGRSHTSTPDEMEVRYRDVPALETNYAVSATFKGHASTAEEISRLLEESMRKRRTSQPAASSAGCIFKNPSSCPAGRLVEELGLKNLSVGQARVSEVHGNFIVNDGGASARDVLELIDRVKAAALEKRGIPLETEVRIVGEPERLYDIAGW